MSCAILKVGAIDTKTGVLTKVFDSTPEPVLQFFGDGGTLEVLEKQGKGTFFVVSTAGDKPLAEKNSIREFHHDQTGNFHSKSRLVAYFPTKDWAKLQKFGTSLPFYVYK